MTQEEKQLLLKDICARLPYGVKVNIEGLPKPKELYSIAEEDSVFYINGYYSTEDIKPYLRPMSSMTKEEDNEYINTFLAMWDAVDWLNAHHFDFRGLIEKGLALEALAGMYV